MNARSISPHDEAGMPAPRVPIAVIGIGCWYPGARNPLQLWENILSRRLEFRTIPDCRLPNDDYCDTAGESIDHSYAQRCAVIDGFEFDWVGRRIPKSMYESTDLVHWLSLDVAEKALKDAGYSPESLDHNGTGVIVGNTLTGDITRSETMRLRWPFVRRVLKASCDSHGLPRDVVEKLESSMEVMYKSVFAPPTPDSLAGGLANTIAGRVCNYFDLHGGGYIVDGACSSSLLAVCTAGRALSAGDMNVAIAGGIDISIDPFELVGFSRAGALSRGEMNVYDKAAAGFIAGEGCGFVVMKRLEDARRDGDRVYAVMRGWGVSSDGKGGIMTPTSSGQAMAIRRAYASAGYSPADLDFVEGHGTGTRVGDQIELKGIFEAQTNGKPAPARRTGMTSLKSIIGHTKAAAGIGAFIKATMAVNRRVLPPTGSCTDPHPVFTDVCHSLYPLVHGRVADSSEVIRAGISAMGFGGINSHVTLESGDAPDTRIDSPLDESALITSNQTSEAFALTAESYDQLEGKISDLLATASQLSDGDLIDLSASLASMANAQHAIRAVVLARSAKQLVETLNSLSNLTAAYPPEPGEATSNRKRDAWISNQCTNSRIGFLFPGQGSQQLQMARKLVARYDWARDIVAKADQIQIESGLPTVSATVFVDTQRVIDRKQQAELRKQLASTEVAQIAIVTASVICARYLETMGIEPAVCGGHSLGEITALYQTGAFDLETLLRLVSLRGRAMASPAGESGAMAALFCSREQAETLIAEAGGYAVIANINGPSQLVVSGEESAITTILANAAAQDISSSRLNVSNAFHSRFVEPAAETIRQQAQVPEKPIAQHTAMFSCMSGEQLGPDVDLRNYLSRQIVSSVDFVSMVQALEPHCDMLLEVGPNKVLSKLTAECLTWSSVECLPTSTNPDVDCDLNLALAKAFVHGVDIQWTQLFEKRLARPFVPINERIFITNPCEKPIADVGEVEQLSLETTGPKNEGQEEKIEDDTSSSASKHSVERFAQATGVSADSLTTYLDRRGDFLAEIIQADLKSTFKEQGLTFPCNATEANDMSMQMPTSNGMQTSPTKTDKHTPIEPTPTQPPAPMVMEQSNNNGHHNNSTSTPMTPPMRTAPPAPQAMQTTATAAAPAESGDMIEELILEIIHERTGFPQESLTSDLRLLDDLNLDSIKAGDIIATAARKLGALGPIDPASLADATIGDVVTAVREAKGGDAAAPTAPAMDPPTTPPMAAEVPAMPPAAPPAITPPPAASPRMQTAPPQMPPALPATPPMQPSAANAMAPPPAPPSLSSSATPPPPSAVPAMTATASPTTQTDDGIEAMILEIIHERTGFPVDSLTPDLRLLDDLNMDSIKAGDIIATAARKLGALGPIDPASLADATIGDVVEAVRQAKGGDTAMSSSTTMEPPMSTAVPSPPSTTSTGAPLPPPMAAPPAAQTPKQTTPTPPPAATQQPPQVSTPAPAAAKPMMAASDGPSVPEWVRSFDIELVAHRPSSTQQDLAGRHYRIVYEASEQAFVELLGKQLRNRNATASFETFCGQTAPAGDMHAAGEPYYVVAILPKHAGEGSSRQRLERMIARLRRAIANTNPMSPDSLAAGVAFVQYGDGQFGHAGMSDIECCTAAGFARALHLESQSLQIRIIDLADKLSHILATDFITNELAAEEVFRDAAYDRLGRRFETRHRLVQSASCEPMPLNLGGDDVVVVTGGGRGITAELAIALAEKTGAKLALVGSSPHPSQSSGAAAEEISSTLQRLSSSSAQSAYFSCNLTDENAVSQLVTQVESQLGPITGLLHGAGRNTPTLASVPTGEAVLNEVSPKVLGAMNLLDALANRKLKCVVGLTSIIGVTGIPGNSWYAFSNETLDLLLRQYKQQNPETLVRSISYSAWSEVGMGAKGQVEANLRRMGVGLIPPHEGVTRFMHAMTHALEDPQLIVTGALGEIDTWRPAGRDKCTASLRYVDQILEFEPGISLTSRVKLSHQQDPYLLDHIYEGTCLFPAVFGLETMSQVASHVLSEPQPLIRIQNIELTRPIIVGAEGEVELEIRATASEMNDAGEIVVAVSLHTERTQFQFPHFAAEIVFGSPVIGKKEPIQVGDALAIDPEKDLYTGILFQGPRFRRWRDTYHLEEGKMIFDAKHCDNTCSGQGVFGEGVQSGGLVTGDPFFRDVLLQSVQAIIPQKTGLPLSIEKIEFFAANAENDMPRTSQQVVTSMLHVIADEVGKEHVSEIVVKDTDGTIRERVTGYRVKVLAIKEEYPTATQLADLEAFDQTILTQQLHNTFEKFGMHSPVAELRRMSQLHELPKEERRVLERPMMEATATRLLQQSGGNAQAPMIDWLASGKPVVANDSQCHISLSHDEDYCLCIAASQSTGCDLAPITERTREQWAALIGMHNEPVLDQLVAAGDCLNKAGTRIWAAVEAVQKTIDEATPVRLRIEKAEGGVIALATDELSEGALVMTMPISLHRKPERMLATVAQKQSANRPTPMAPPTANNSAPATNGMSTPMANGTAQPAMPEEPKLRSDLAAPGETKSIDNVSAVVKWDGPRDQAVFEHRFVVTFKECATRGKHVQHTQYLGWMGSMRENGLLYLVPDMVLKLSDGKSGMATNWTEVDVVGEAMMGDVLIARLWMESMTDASVVLACDFAKVLPGNRLERLAFVRQATTWVRLDGRNDPVKEPFPKFLYDAIKSMDSDVQREPKLPELPESLGRIKLEKEKLHAMEAHQPLVVWEEDFSTCLDDSNIVANIYYSRYFHWQWRTSDLFLHSKAPHLMTGDVAMGDVRELVPLNSRIDYVRDAFPFDRIRTELAVTRSSDVAATFQFTHYRVHENGHKEKLSVGTQDVVWVRRTPNGNAVPEPFPLAVREAIRGQQVAMGAAMQG